MKKDLLETIFEPLFNTAQAFCNLINPTKLEITAKSSKPDSAPEKVAQFKSVSDIVRPEPVNMIRIEPHSPGIL